MATDLMVVASSLTLKLASQDWAVNTMNLDSVETNTDLLVVGN